MAAINSISLRIYGGSQGKGFSEVPLVSVGAIPDKFKPMPPTIVNEQHAWMITHAQEYTYYAVYSTAVTTSAGQPGQLLISLFLPPSKKLGEGNSPLNLLESLTDAFAIQALRGGKLPDAPVDSSPFKTLLGRYRLEPRGRQLPVMSGNEPVSFCVKDKTQLSALMRYSQYNELARVGRLELGYKCATTVALPINGAKPVTSSGHTASKVDEPGEPHVNSWKKEEEPAGKTGGGTGGIDLGGGSSASTGGSYSFNSEEPAGGGISLGLDDEPAPRPWYKKPVGVAAIIIGVAVLAFAGLMAAGGGDDSKKEPGNPDIAVVDTVAADTVTADTNSQLAAGGTKKEDVSPEPAPKPVEPAEPSAAKLKAKKESLANVAKKKAEEEAKRKKAAEEAKKRKEEQQQQQQQRQQAASWQAKVRANAASCPIELRYGVKVTSISCTSSSVVITINYQELSKYDLDSEDRSRLAKDRSSVLSKYASGVPSGVSRTVIQKDRSGRTI